MKVKIKNIFLVASSEYMKWLLHPKIILIFSVLVPIRELIIIPMTKAAEEMNQPLNIFEPCIALMNSGIITLLLPLAYIVLISSFPTVDGNMLFYIMRMGRRNWILGELLFQLMSVITFCAVLIIATVIQVSQISFVANGWSLVATDYDKLYSEISSFHMNTLLPPNLYYQLPPYKAFFFSTSLLVMWLLLCAMFFLAGCICAKKLIFYFGLIVQIALGSGLCAIKNICMWLFPIGHSILKVHYQDYFRKYIFSPQMSLTLFFIVQILLAVFVYKKAKTVNLDRIGGDAGI